MSTATLVDLLLVLMLLSYAGGMYHTGIVTAALSLGGMLGGGLFALWAVPEAIQRWATTGELLLPAGALLVIGVLVGAAIGQTLGALVGRELRSRVRLRPARALDSLLGSVAAVAVGSVVVWLAASVLVGAAPGAASTVASSRVIQGIDAAMPSSADRVLAGAYRAWGSSGLPRVFTGVGPEPIRPVEPPSGEVAQGSGIDAAGDSVIRVSGAALDCGRNQVGSGWVLAHERVVTNAHVVAGVDSPSVQVGGTGPALPATTVVFDPQEDIAVLAVPGLPSDPLPLGPTVDRGDDVVVAGFPLGGPYDVEPGRVRETVRARGAGIDGTPGVYREVYSINATVQQGNSGGPMLTPDGQVVGTVFARSETHPSTGYVLTLEETRPALERAAAATDEVSTGACAA